MTNILNNSGNDSFLDDLFGDDDFLNEETTNDNYNNNQVLVPLPYPQSLLMEVWEELSWVNQIFDEIIQFPIDKIIKPLITYSIESNFLKIHVEVIKDSFETGYMPHRMDEVDYEKTSSIPLVTEECKRMADYMLTFNESPIQYRTLWIDYCIVYLEGFTLFNIKLDDSGYDPKTWMLGRDPKVKTLLRKRKIKKYFKDNVQKSV